MGCSNSKANEQPDTPVVEQQLSERTRRESLIIESTSPRRESIKRESSTPRRDSKEMKSTRDSMREIKKDKKDKYSFDTSNVSRDEAERYIRQYSLIVENVMKSIISYPELLEEEDLLPVFRENFQLKISKSPAVLAKGDHQPLRTSTKPKGTFMSNNSTSIYLCSPEWNNPAVKAVIDHVGRQGVVKHSATNLDAIEEAVCNSAYMIFISNKLSMSDQNCLFALSCAGAYDKKIIVVHDRSSMAFPKYDFQPVEFKDNVLFENVIVYSPDKSDLAIASLSNMIQLPQRKLDKVGLLTVTVVKAEKLVVKEESIDRIYCIIQFDQNEAVLEAASGDPANPEFRETAKFDVARVTSELSISFWCRKSKKRDKFLGACSFSPTFSGSVMEELFQLENAAGSPIGGRVLIRTQYQSPEKDKKLKMEDFVLMKVIGKGTFGKVLQVTKKDTGRVYAMKVIRKVDVVERSEINHIMAERQVLAQIHHPFIINLKFSFQSEDKLYMVLSFINGGELFKHLQDEGQFTEPRAKFYAAELLLALEYLHSYDIIYRDVKPENILLTVSGHIALCDFGLCKMKMGKDTKTNTFCGTPEYLAPELLIDEGYTKAVDWWTLGVLLYEMLAGIPPFYSEDIQEMYKKILYADLTFPEDMSDQAKNILSLLLEKDPSKRLGRRGADSIKKHPFFSDIDWKKLLKRQLEPPIKPDVKSGLDTSNFDKELTEQIPVDSYVEKKLSDSVQKKFEGFTYTNESKMTYGATPSMI